MNIRLMVAALVGSALTLALSAVAQAPKPKAGSECAQLADINSSIAALTDGMRKLDAVDRKLDRLVRFASSQTAWSQEIDLDMAAIKKQLVLPTTLQGGQQ